MTAQPLFSILVANYNNAAYLEEMLASIDRQTYTNWEVVIVDDCSTDSSEEVYARLADKRIRVIRNPKNKGCGYTKYAAAAAAKGELIAYVDPDDAIRVDALEIMVDKHLQNPNASTVYSTLYECDADLRTERISTWVGAIPKGSNNLLSDKISHFVSIKREAYQKTEGINPNYKRAVDKDLYYKIEEVGDVVFIPEPLYYYRIHKGGISASGNHLKAAFWKMKAIVDTYERRKKIPHIQNIKLWKIKLELMKIYLFEAKHAIYKLKLMKGIHYIFKAIFTKPTSIVERELS